MNRAFIEQLITGHEGNRLHVYPDTKGKFTIGVGFNLQAADAPHICGLFGIDYDGVLHGTMDLTQAQVDEIFNYQLNLVIGQAMQIFPNFVTMPDAVQAVICDMIFNLGFERFSEFHDTIRDLKAGNYTQAAKDALDSEWAHQVPTRAADDARLLEAA